MSNVGDPIPATENAKANGAKIGAAAGRPVAAIPAATVAVQNAGRKRIFTYDIAALVFLMIVAAIYVTEDGWFAGLTKIPQVKLAIEAMWFGALGGLMISLKGIYDHSVGPDGWDESFNLWHYGRPFSGAVAGAITVILLRVVNSGDGATATPIVYAAAFIFGTQERRFFGFLYEAAQLIVQVPEDAKPAGLQITEVQPAEGGAGAVVMVKGQGIDPKAIVRLGAAALDKLTIANDGGSAAGLAPAQAPGTDTVDVIVVNPNGTSFVLPGKFKYSN